MTAPIELPDDFRETMAVFRERADLARIEMARGKPGPALSRHIKDGGGDPEFTLMMLDLLDQLIAAVPVNQQAEATVKLLVQKATEFVGEVEGFINERPDYINSINECAPSNDRDYWRWNGHAEARRQLAQLLNRTVPHELGETTKSKGDAATGSDTEGES